VRADRTTFHDSVLAALVAVVSLTLFLTQDVGRLEAQGLVVDGLRRPDVLGGVLVLAACVPVAVRRRRPLAGLCASLVPETLLAAFGYGYGLGGIAALVLLYSVASHRGLAVALGGLLLSLAVYAMGSATGPVRTAHWSAHLMMGVVLVAVWGAGRSLRLRRAYLEELKDRAARLERAHAADTRAARAEERSRIARELHDVVAHHVSVMTVQAAAARRVLASDPEVAREALTAIEHTGRQALAEMREIVGVLRTEPGVELRPQPGVRDLPALAEQMTEAGLPTRLTVDGLPEGGLPAGVGLAVYRTVQEALTNSLRHAGPGTKAEVTVRLRKCRLDVRVSDDGRGEGQAAGRPGGPGEPGHGLAGIRERVALYGGILSVGPKSGGGFEVRATFPLKDGP